MKIVGELINSSRKAVKEAIEDQNRDAIIALAREQVLAGADIIDVNAGAFVENEPEHLRWLVETVQTAADIPCCIDSPAPAAIEAALRVHKGQAMINSISFEKDRYEKLIPLIAGTDLKVVALCMSNDGMPETADQRLAVAEKLVNALVKNNIKLANIYVDPLVQSVATNPAYGKEFLNAIARIMNEFEGIHTICGLSNISFGLPNRKFLNQTFIAIAIAYGLDSAIINPLDKQMIANIKAAEALTGRDDFCMGYITAFRQGFFPK